MNKASVLSALSKLEGFVDSSPFLTTTVQPQSKIKTADLEESHMTKKEKKENEKELQRKENIDVVKKKVINKLSSRRFNDE